MKKILLLLAQTGLTIFLHAQINKGQWLAGGMAGFAHGNNSAEENLSASGFKSTVIQANINGGYFIVNKLCAGLRGGISVDNADEAEVMAVPEINGYSQFAASSRNTVWSIGPFVRYYFLPATNKINILADVGCAYNSNIVKNAESIAYIGATQNLPGNYPDASQFTSINKYHNISVTASAGPAFFVNPSTSIEVMIGYTAQKFNAAIINTGSYLMVSAGVQIHLGK